MIHVQIEEEVDAGVPALVETAAQATLAHQNAGEVELTVVLTNDARLHTLNNEFLGINAPTDVLSFPADFTDPDTNVRYLGDVLISVQRALEQAVAAGNSLRDELFLLTVHGVLHLLGYDHAVPEEKDRMWAAQEAILAQLKSGI